MASLDWQDSVKFLSIELSIYKLLIYMEKFTVNFFSKMTAPHEPCGFQPLLKNLSIKLSTESVGNRA